MCTMYLHFYCDVILVLVSSFYPADASSPYMLFKKFYATLSPISRSVVLIVFNLIVIDLIVDALWNISSFLKKLFFSLSEIRPSFSSLVSVRLTYLSINIKIMTETKQMTIFPLNKLALSFVAFLLK